jgi:hypothetical protein
LNGRMKIESHLIYLIWMDLTKIQFGCELAEVSCFIDGKF